MMKFKESQIFKNSLSIVSLVSLLTISSPLKPNNKQINVLTSQEINDLEKIIGDIESAPETNQNEMSDKELIKEIWYSTKEEKFGDRNYNLSINQRLALTREVLDIISVLMKAKWSSNLENLSQTLYNNEYDKLTTFQKTNTNLRAVGSEAVEVINNNRIKFITFITLIITGAMARKYFKNSHSKK